TGLQIGGGLDLTSGLIAVKHGKLDVNENEVGPLGEGLGHPDATGDGLKDVVARTAKKVAQDAAPILLVLNDSHALAHAPVFRIGSFSRKLDPLAQGRCTQIPLVHPTLRPRSPAPTAVVAGLGRPIGLACIRSPVATQLNPNILCQTAVPRNG